MEFGPAYQDGWGSITAMSWVNGVIVDIERTMQFILEQQAQISAQFAAFQTQSAASEARFTNDIVQINSVLLDVAITQERTNAILETLAERQILTEQTLNSLMATVERHIANHK